MLRSDGFPSAELVRGNQNVLNSDDSFTTLPSEEKVDKLVPILILSGEAWRTNELLGKGKYCPNPSLVRQWESHFDIRRLLCSDEVTKTEVSEIKREIISGRYQVVIVDNVNMSWFGKITSMDHIVKTYVEGGGRMAFVNGEGFQIPPYLKRVFNTTWTASAYYRTTWGSKAASADLISEQFPGYNPSDSFSCKAVTYRDVPFEDRLFGVLPSSTHQSLSMQLTGHHYAGPSEATAETDLDEETGKSDNYDISVATRAIGLGRIVSFGDVNIDDATQKLSFCFCCGPLNVPSSDLKKLFLRSKDKMELIISMKREGNLFFHEKDFESAKKSYETALDIIGEIPVSAEQRKERVYLLSNLSEVFFRTGDFGRARDLSSEAIKLDDNCVKAKYRHAKALLGMYDNGALAQSRNNIQQLLDEALMMLFSIDTGCDEVDDQMKKAIKSLMTKIRSKLKPDREKRSAAS